METGPPAFCQRCGARLTRRDVQGAKRPFCDSCGFVHFFDPKVAVVALVEDPEGRLLYTKRNHEPKLGAWAWPGGWIWSRAKKRTASASGPGASRPPAACAR